MWQAVKRRMPSGVSDSLRRHLLAVYCRVFPSPPLSPDLEFGHFSGFELAYRRGTTDEEVIRYSFDRDIFFAGVPEYSPSSDHTILDVGAHIGTFALLAASKVPQGRVYAIEACKESFNLLRINIALNRVPNIEASHLALSDRQGTGILHHDRGNWGHSIMAAMTGYGETVEMDSLAHFIHTRGIARCHFMKVNCEGAEFPILLGASRAVLQRFQVILVLYHCDIVRRQNEQDLSRHLQASGFKVVIRNAAAKRGWIIAVNAAEVRREPVDSP